MVENSNRSPHTLPASEESSPKTRIAVSGSHPESRLEAVREAVLPVKQGQYIESLSLAGSYNPLEKERDQLFEAPDKYAKQMEELRAKVLASHRDGNWHRPEKLPEQTENSSPTAQTQLPQETADSRETPEEKEKRLADEFAHATAVDRRTVQIGFGAIILGTIASVAAGINACDSVHPKPTPQPPAIVEKLPPVSNTATPQPTPLVVEITTATPTATAIPKSPYDKFMESDYWQNHTLTKFVKNQAGFKWIEDYKIAPGGPNEKNDFATSAARIEATLAGHSAHDEYYQPERPYFQVGPKTQRFITSCLEGTTTDLKDLCDEVYTTAGADLSEENTRTDTDPAYQAAEKIINGLFIYFTEHP